MTKKTSNENIAAEEQRKRYHYISFASISSSSFSSLILASLNRFWLFLRSFISFRCASLLSSTAHAVSVFSLHWCDCVFPTHKMQIVASELKCVSSENKNKQQNPKERSEKRIICSHAMLEQRHMCSATQRAKRVQWRRRHNRCHCHC